ncbi:porin [Phaeovulum sp. NW3]|uniref:porin n=1 Tax=Phaeovulum sp. NW3 TaxID=2934933 RepID=UPI00202139B8|nr:porin [Phaeovulum sp. NW3]MCL7464121.1 porin [Phaeovulum sp. NW3]
MKKILLASTALVAFAGAAAAEVSLSGVGVISIIGGDGQANGDHARFLTLADVGFTMTGETDGGLAFGAYIELDEAALTKNKNEAVWVSGAFGKVTFGDTNSAIDQVMAETTQGASLTDEYTIHAGAFANFLDESVDNTIMRYDYAMGDIVLAASLEVDENDVKDIGWSIGAAYNMAITGGSVTLSAGYQVASDYEGVGANHSGVNPDNGTIVAGAAADAKVAAIGASVKLDNGLGMTAQYATIENFNGAGNDADQWGIGASYTTGAITVGASYGEIDADVNAADVESYGIGASYALGGGTNLFAGMVSEKFNGGASLEKYQAGIILKF